MPAPRRAVESRQTSAIRLHLPGQLEPVKIWVRSRRAVAPGPLRSRGFRHREARYSPYTVPVPRLGRQADREETVEQTPEGDVRFQNRQLRVEAVVNATPERKMASLLAPDVERVRIVECRRIPVRRAEQVDHLLARAQTLAAHRTATRPTARLRTPRAIWQALPAGCTRTANPGLARWPAPARSARSPVWRMCAASSSTSMPPRARRSPPGRWNGSPPSTPSRRRPAASRPSAAPRLDELELWLQSHLPRISAKTPLGAAIRYALPNPAVAKARATQYGPIGLPSVQCGDHGRVASFVTTEPKRRCRQPRRQFAASTRP